MDLWFYKSKKFDEEIIQQFSKYLTQAENKNFDHWDKNTSSLLALIILLDQLSRHIYRGDKKSFQNDKKSLHLAKNYLKTLDDNILNHYIKGTNQCKFKHLLFFTLPLQHSENLNDQQSFKEFWLRVKNLAQNHSINIKI